MPYHWSGSFGWNFLPYRHIVNRNIGLLAHPCRDPGISSWSAFKQLLLLPKVSFCVKSYVALRWVLLSRVLQVSCIIDSSICTFCAVMQTVKCITWCMFCSHSKSILAEMVDYVWPPSLSMTNPLWLKLLRLQHWIDYTTHYRDTCCNEHG